MQISRQLKRSVTRWRAEDGNGRCRQGRQSVGGVCTSRLHTRTSRRPGNSESLPCVAAGTNWWGKDSSRCRSDFDADDEGTTAGDPDATRPGNLGADHADRTPAYGPLPSPVRIRRPASLQIRRSSRFGTCSTRSETPAPIARPSRQQDHVAARSEQQQNRLVFNGLTPVIAS
jgi:hypothetical protein